MEMRKNRGKRIERKAERYPQGREAGENQLSKNICHIFCALGGRFFKEMPLALFSNGQKTVTII